MRTRNEPRRHRRQHSALVTLGEAVLTISGPREDYAVVDHAGAVLGHVDALLIADRESKVRFISRLFARLGLILGMLGGFTLTPGTTPTISAGHDPDAPYCARPAEFELLELINDFRAGRGLDPLALSAPLGAAATHKSEEMAREEYLAHTSPDGVTPRELVTAHGYEHNTAIGENLAAGQESAAATFTQWRESASHRELLLNASFAAVGIARAYNVETDYDWYWTAEFGGVLAEPAEPCDEEPGAPAATPAPAAGGAVPVHVICDGTRLADGTYDLTCREA